MRRAVFGILCGLSLPAMASEPILRDRDPGAHVIEYEVTLDAPPDEVFRLWSTADGLQQFLAPGARVGATVGSLYQITFDPEGDPEGAKHGTKGARLLHILPGKELAAEWTFPPLGEKLNTPPFPTWIEVRFASAPGAPGRTRLHFAHYGFADDPDWKQAFDFFATGNWPLILNRLIRGRTTTVSKSTCSFGRRFSSMLPSRTSGEPGRRRRGCASPPREPGSI